jgi:glycosyltransferase involved in cell wall biosynthesis
VAIVHDYLNQRGGAERVALELARMFTGSPIFTSLYRPGSTFSGFREHDIHTSALDRLPVDRGFRNCFFLYPAAFRAFGALSHDLVISSSSAWAHSVRTAPGSFHVVYCHTPARWLYGREYLGSSVRQSALQPLLGALRRWDRHAAARADLYIANSREVRARIAHAYGIDAPVVHPPVDTARFRPRARGERLLVVSRLLPYKRVDTIVATATRAGIGLDVVGDGPALPALRRMAGRTVTFHGQVSDAAVTELMEGCRAFCLPGTEDFGLAPVEAQAAGKPVIAFAAGGALETIVEGRTGAFFDRRDPDDVLSAIRRCDAIDTAPEVLAAGAARFSRAAFRTRLLGVIEARRAALGARDGRFVRRRPGAEPAWLRP